MVATAVWPRQAVVPKGFDEQRARIGSGPMQSEARGEANGVAGCEIEGREHGVPRECAASRWWPVAVVRARRESIDPGQAAEGPSLKVSGSLRKSRRPFCGIACTPPGGSPGLCDGQYAALAPPAANRFLQMLPGSLDLSWPGEPAGNAHVEALGGSLRRGCLSQNRFTDLDDAEEILS